MPQLKPTRGTFLSKPDGSPKGCLTASLICCWLMNEGAGNTVFNLSGKGKVMTFAAGAAKPIWQGGNSGSSVYFESSDYISGPSLGTLSLPLTIVTSIKHSTTGVWDPILTTHEVNNKYYGATLNIHSTGTMWLQYGDGDSNTSYDRNTKSGTSSLATNQWYHVAGVIRGQNDMNIYLNGADDGGSYSGSATNMDTSSGVPVFGRWIGHDNDEYLNGNIEYIYLFNRALSASEIALLYREPFCMFARTGRPQLRSGQIVGLAGTSTGLSSLSTTAKAISKVGGTVVCTSDGSAILSLIRGLAASTAGFSAVNGLLAITIEKPPEMEISWLREALFNGMTANAFKLSTVLSLGWFWNQNTGCSVLYRGHNMEEIDFASILAVFEMDDCEISPPAYISHSSCSTYFYIIRRFNNCGYQECTLAAAVKVSIDSNGDLAEPKPNKIYDSISGLTNGNKIRLVWFYCPLEQKSSPVCFNIYYDNRMGQIDYQNSLATISYKGRKFYSYQSSMLEAGEYLFAIRAKDAVGLEKSSLAQLKIQLEPATIDAINILRAEAV